LFLQRVEIFCQHVEEDRQCIGFPRSRSAHRPASYITVHRGRILEDGYQQLSLLTTNTLKGTIQVKFINEQVVIRQFYICYGQCLRLLHCIPLCG